MLAKGIQLQIGNAGTPTETFSLIPGVTELDIPAITWGSEEDTNHDTTTPVTTRKRTVRTDGPLGCTVKEFNEATANHALLLTLSRSGATRNFRIVYPNSSIGTKTLSAWVSHQPDTPATGLHAGKFQLHLTDIVGDAQAILGGVTVTDAQAGAYVTAEYVQLSATFDEAVHVTGTPRIAITLGSGVVNANYHSGSGSNVLVFRYTFQGGDAATAGQFAVGTSIALNGGTILDVVGQAPAALTFSAPNTAAYTVN